MRPDFQQPHERPVLKKPVWTPEIPIYFYVGGLAGASAGVGLLADEDLARRAWGLAFAGSLISPALLISDLGVPTRFLNMLRMFKVTSPMSVGSWVLSGFGAATAPAAAHAFFGLGRVGRSAQVASALLGLPLASYTGALLAATSIPAWHDARRELPFLFVAGAAASAGAALTILSPDAPAARRLAIGGAVVELAIAQAMEQRPAVKEAFEDVKPLKRAALGLTAAGAALVATRRRRLGGALISAGALAERFTVFRAGSASAERSR